MAKRDRLTVGPVELQFTDKALLAGGWHKPGRVVLLLTVKHPDSSVSRDALALVSDPNHPSGGYWGTCHQAGTRWTCLGGLGLGWHNYLDSSLRGWLAGYFELHGYTASDDEVNRVAGELERRWGRVENGQSEPGTFIPSRLDVWRLLSSGGDYRACVGLSVPLVDFGMQVCAETGGKVEKVEADARRFTAHIPGCGRWGMVQLIALRWFAPAL